MLIISLLIILAVVILYIILTYNQLVRLQNLTREGWSGIDVQLKQRANLIPNLVETVKGYMGHERGVLEKVTELRSQALASGSVPERAANENMLTSALRQLFAVSENYPDLKASQNFIELQNTLTSIENQIQLSRRYYNGAVRDLNIAIQSFPSNLIAKSFHFTPAEFFEIEDAKEREVPTVKLV
ncbi:hypothetical protein AQUSIP_02940 [Aquicella siphonis]|uniref:LemA family protein n=1 Tax=Aquicella siphonis TaxID=254247 RepID=A0A5E4PDK1_9COXI|nr:LemA family protein [Aquicella siphonis]VVC75019.1 hypothetical protein AQUSIP_02940 [Aquicella siphonis]